MKKTTRKKPATLKFINVSLQDKFSDDLAPGIPLIKATDTSHSLVLLPPKIQGECPCLIMACELNSVWNENYFYLNVENRTIEKMIKTLQTYLKEAKKHKILPQVREDE